MGLVGCGEYGYAFEGFDSIHFVEQSGEYIDSVVGSLTVSLPADGLDFIEEDDTWSCGAGAGKYVANGSFGVSDIFGEEFGTFDGEEVEIHFGGDGLRGECFGTSGRSVEEETLGWGTSEILQDFWVLEDC